ncbi:MAG: DUF5317 domain-containing protein [Firmicutes bacterium]|jgi:hypothetical protein|nr:DUF5317 domain-containing protein [Bacillota bacterium]MDH7495248.1 DUF5317 domain-containing protein [Bacillota bacterium]
MLVDTAVASLVVGKLRGGTLSSLGGVPFKRVECIVASLVIETAIVGFGLRGTSVVRAVAPYAFFLGYVLLLYAIWENRRIRWMPLIGIGVALNFLVILCNGMRMPVSADMLDAVGMARQVASIEAGNVLTYRLIDSGTRLWQLGDVIPIGWPYPIHRVISVGDVLMAVGVFLLIQHAMLANGSPRTRLGRRAGTLGRTWRRS